MTNPIDSAGGIGVGSRTEAGSRRRRARRSHRVLAALACGMGITCGDDTGGVAGPVEVPNRAPVAVGEIPAQSVFLGETATVVVSSYFSDPDGDALSFEASSSDSAVVGVSVSGDTVTVDALDRGSATVTVTARDPTGGVAEQEFEATVPNRAPVVAAEIPAQTLFLGETATVVVSSYFSDPDGDALSFDVSSSDSAVVVTSVSDSTVTLAARGSATVTVRARDPAGGVAEQAFEATVPNREPVAVGEIPAQTLFLGETATVVVSSYFSDPDGDALSFEAASADDQIATAAVSGTLVVVRGVTDGATEVTVTAADPLGASTRQSFVVTVERPNQPPVVTRAIPAQTVEESESASVSLDAYFSDPEGGPLHYGATSSDDAVATANVSGSDLVIGGVLEGTATVTVTARDRGGLTVQQQFGVTVETSGTTNQAPVVVQQISDQTLGVGKVFGGPVAQYFSDPDNDVLVYSASSSNPGAVTARTAHLPLFPVVFSVEAVAEGTATITLTATDTGGLSASLTFEVTAQILPNSAPVVTQNIPDETVNVGQELTPVQNLHGYFSDPDNDRLGFSASSSNRAVLRTGVTLVRWWINGQSAGTATVTVRATDEVGASVSQEVTVTVVELPNETPIVVASIPDQSMRVGETDSVSVGNLNGYFSDPDNDPLTFRVQSSARGTVSVWLQSNELYLRAFLAGSVTITVTATDPGLRNVSQEFTVTVTSADVSPPPPPSPQGPAPRPRADARDPPDAHTR